MSDVYVLILVCLQFSQIEGVLEKFYGTKPKIQCVHPKVHKHDKSINYSLPATHSSGVSVSTECWRSGSGTDWDLFQPWLHPPGLWEKWNHGNAVRGRVETAPVCGQIIRLQCVRPWRARVLPTALLTPLTCSVTHKNQSIKLELMSIINSTPTRNLNLINPILILFSKILLF